jgi:YfiR/HmsC-like
VSSANQKNRTVATHHRKSGGAAVRARNTFVYLKVILFLLLIQTLVPQFVFGQEDSASEYELKAAMLYNLVQFVEWPPKAYPGSQAPTILCILGRDPFGESLPALVANHKIGRPMEIRHVREQGTHDCHVLYISSSERKNIAKILSTLEGSNVLSVGEMSQFASRGGMIQFALEEKRLRFDINLQAASHADLQISSRLLALAKIVRSSGGSAGVGVNASERAAPKNPNVSSL